MAAPRLLIPAAMAHRKWPASQTLRVYDLNPLRMAGPSESLEAGTLRALPAASGPAASLDSAGRQNRRSAAAAAPARTGSAAPSGPRARAHSPDRSTAVSMEGAPQPPSPGWPPVDILSQVCVFLSLQCTWFKAIS